MRKLAQLLCLLAQVMTVYGQTTIQQLPLEGASLQDIIPDQWTILSQTAGDLNRDGISDLAFVLKDTEPENITDNSSFGIDSVDTNPRILGIYLGQDNAVSYRKALQSNTFIIQPSSPTMNEPFQEILITPEGALQILFSISYNAGSWYMTNQNYQFVFHNDQFELHFLERNEVNRRNGSIQRYSVNFPDGKMNIERGTISSDEPESVETKYFTLDRLKTLESLKEPFTWSFLEFDI